MRSFLTALLVVTFFIMPARICCQKLLFKQANKDSKSNSEFYPIQKMAQDNLGYLWLATQRGLQRYDGNDVLTLQNDPLNSNSLANDFLLSVCVDHDNILWIAPNSMGVDRYDPATKTFTHFRHNAKDPSSIASDTVSSVLSDHLDELWIATSAGLDLMNKKTGTFTHYSIKRDDPSFVSGNNMDLLYEDHKGYLWIAGVQQNVPQFQSVLQGFDRTTGKFTHYFHDPGRGASLGTGWLGAMFEDSKGNFWIGMSDDVEIMDRRTGTFSHFPYDSLNSGKISSPTRCKDCVVDHITFINEDGEGAIWIGSLQNGINRYDPASKKISHYGAIQKELNLRPQMDTANGNFDDNYIEDAISTRDNLLWIGTSTRGLYSTNPSKLKIPFYPLDGTGADAFYYDRNSSTLWIGTGNGGVICKDIHNNIVRTYRHDPLNKNSLSNNDINGFCASDNGKLWIATDTGLCQFDPTSNRFTTFLHDDHNPNSIIDNTIYAVYTDHDQNLWVGTDKGLDRMNLKTGAVIHYRANYNDTASLTMDLIYCIKQTSDGDMWVGTYLGLNRLNPSTGKVRRYLSLIPIKNIFVDHENVLWIGSSDGLYRFDSARNTFLPFMDPGSKSKIRNILTINEDDQKHLWVSTTTFLLRINENRDELKIYDSTNGVHKSQFFLTTNFKKDDGELFFGDQTGYYSFLPASLKEKDMPPIVNVKTLTLGDKEIQPAENGVLKVPLWQAKEIVLKYDQDNFSFDFEAVNYANPGGEKYLFKLENYDNTWHYTSADHKAYFFHVPPGTYIFHAKAFNADGVWGEKTIKIIITPPWWRRWWAYVFFTLIFVLCIWGFIYYRSRKLIKENLLLETKVLQRTDELKTSLEELRSAQAQLIQSEKMASLGELTAGIAHEIQNPLNFVNNFSEVNKEMIDELQNELRAGNVDGALSISTDIRQNEEKISHHGKRADGIVKGMLQHSRTSSGHKELIDLNALCEEYLRLSYHGMRAKDKSFNADFKMTADENVGKIKATPQDIGRVLLNLFNNAFYAVNEKSKLATGIATTGVEAAAEPAYRPMVSVSTKRSGNSVQVKIQDNGSGMPQSIVEKIFQPFFTTKPTGSGTGLGLSLSYDIIKTYGGEIKVKTKEGEGSEFVVHLPLNSI